MEIATSGKNGYKLRGKVATVVVDNGDVVIEGDKPFKINSPGEYEVRGASVIGIFDPVGKIYIVELDGMRTVCMSGISDKLTSAQVAEIGSVDIVILPELKADITSQIDPWIIVSEKGAEVPPVPKLSVAADKLPTETQTVILERKG